MDGFKLIKNYESSEIFVDLDEHQEYEINGFFRKIINFSLVSCLNLLPAASQKIIKKTHKDAKKVIDNKTTHEALEVLYKHPERKRKENFVQKIARKIWFELDNSRSVRNRLKLVKKIFEKTVLDLKDSHETIKVLSIASGSSRALLEVLSNLDIKNEIILKFLDKSTHAVEYSKKVTASLFGNKFTNYKTEWILDTANSFPKYWNGQKIDIIEMVGLLDYFDDEKVLKIFTSIFNNLSDGGTLISANIANNKERKFLTKVVGWDMVYKTPEQFVDLATNAGFDRKKISIVSEPLNIHFVLIAQK
ncbi:MAG: class I SAM-dependent methyltransferase [Candidatus Marinimicrobia bacterium]|nr:class I SAM-dependent methyltransferase [Candidatus Neomarinimicrobiota bacterium]